MVSLYELFMYDITNYGEVTRKDSFDVSGSDILPDKVIDPKSLVKRKEGIQVFDRDNLRGE